MAQQELSRRDFLVRSVKRGAAAVLVIAGVAQGGRMYGAQEERGKHLSPGDLTPELRAKLQEKKYFVIETPPGLTIANMRSADLDIAPFPLSDGQEAIEQDVLRRKWLAVNPEEFYLPASKENPTLGDLNSLVTRKSTAMRSVDSGIQVVLGSPVELAWIDLILRLETGKGSINGGEGFILTGAKVGTNGVALGRREPGGPLEWSTFDASPKNLVPELRAAGIVVATSTHSSLS